MADSLAERHLGVPVKYGDGRKERQKLVTDIYRDNYDKIFGKKPQHNEQDGRDDTKH